MDLIKELRSKLTDKDNMPRMKSELCVNVELAERAIEEIERLRRCMAKDPKTLLLAFEDGDHQRLARAAAAAIDRAEIAEEKNVALDKVIDEQQYIIRQQVADITKLCDRVKYLEKLQAEASWQSEYDRQYYETKPKEEW